MALPHYSAPMNAATEITKNIKALRAQIERRRTWDPMDAAKIDGLVADRQEQGMSAVDALRAALLDSGVRPIA